MSDNLFPAPERFERKHDTSQGTVVILGGVWCQECLQCTSCAAGKPWDQVPPCQLPHSAVPGSNSDICL